MNPRHWRRVAGELLALLGLTVLIGCAGDTTGPETRKEITVFGYLFVGEAVTEQNAIRVAEIRPVAEFYDPAEAVVSNALVTLRKHGAAPDTLTMVRPGYYAAPDLVIEPETAYDLGILIPGRAPISSTTTTPVAFTTRRDPRVLPGTMRIDAIPDSFAMVLSCRNPDQMLLLDVFCEEDWRTATYINPTGSRDHPADYAEFGGDHGEPRHITAYFQLKNLPMEGDDHKLGYYEALMVFYGRYTVTCLAMNDNYYRYLYRDHPEESGGIVGGLGVFGSACRKQYRVEVTP